MRADADELQRSITPSMRDTELGPELLDRQLEHIWGTPGTLWGTLATVDHKRIGRRYIATAFIFLAMGGVLALLIRLQLAGPEQRLIGPDRYNQIFTTAMAHAQDGVWTFDPWIVTPLLVTAGLYTSGVIALWRRAGIG